jgi:hypothetical protein
MKLLTLIMFVFTAAAFGQATAPPACSEQLKNASIQGVFIGDLKEQVTSDFPSTLWMDDPIDGTKIGLVNRGLDKYVSNLEVRVFKGKVYKIKAMYGADLAWKDTGEMASAISSFWSIPETWSRAGSFGREISCKDRIVMVDEPRSLTLTDAVAENLLNADLRSADEAKKKKFKP